MFEYYVPIEVAEDGDAPVQSDPDITTVINGLEHCMRTDGDNCKYCPYFNGECVDELSRDALRVIKRLIEKNAGMEMKNDETH